MKVTARFYSSEQLLPVHLLVINLTDKKQVRMFADKANGWLRKGVGYSVSTETDTFEYENEGR